MASRLRIFGTLTFGVGLTVALVTTGGLSASAVPGVPGDSDFLGAAQSVAVLGGQTVTNTGPSVINGDLGVSPGSAVTGFPPGIVNGTIYIPPAAQAVAGQLDASNAYDALEALVGTPVPTELGGITYGPGVYQGAPAAGTLQITGTVVLSGGPDDIFVFQSDSTLITASSSIVSLVGGARACNVFWQVGSSATLGSSSVFSGTVIARTSVTATTSARTGATADEGGRFLALDGAVTLDSNVITLPGTCATTATPPLPGTLPPGVVVPPVVVPPVTTTPSAVAAAAVSPAAELAATAVDNRRPMAVAFFVVLLGVAMLSSSTLVRRRIRH